MSQQVAMLGAPVDLQHGQSISEEWLVTGTVPAATPANTQISATASRGAGQGSLQTLQGPGDEYWSVEGVYSYGAVPSPDMQLIISTNGTNQPLTLLFSSVLQTNYARPGLTQAWTLSPASTLSFFINPIGTVGGSPLQITFKMKIGRYRP